MLRNGWKERWTVIRFVRTSFGWFIYTWASMKFFQHFTVKKTSLPLPAENLFCFYIQEFAYKYVICEEGSRVGVVVRALAFHQCVPGSIPGPGVIWGLSLLVLYSAPRGFSPGTSVFPSPQKPTFDLIWFIWFTVSPISTALVLG